MSGMHLSAGVTVTVVAPTRPAVRVTPPSRLGPTVVAVPGLPGPGGNSGPPGPPGPEGASGDGRGIAWFSGEGPPTTVPGSNPGDYYLDSLTGTYYRLGD